MTHPGQVLGPNARAGVAWRISSYSNSGGGSCVEAGALPDHTGRVAVRHSHHPDGLALIVDRPTWTAFIIEPGEANVDDCLVANRDPQPMQDPAVPVVAIEPGTVTFCDQELDLLQQRIKLEQRMQVRPDVAAVHTG